MSTLFLDGFVAFFPLRSTSHAICGIRDGIQAGLGYLFTARLAPAIAAVFDPLDCRFNLIEGVSVVFEQTKREFLIGVVTPKLCHIGRYAGGLAVVVQGIIFHLGAFALKSCPQSHKPFSMQREVGVRHFVGPLQSTVVQEFRLLVLTSGLRVIASSRTSTVPRRWVFRMSVASDKGVTDE